MNENQTVALMNAISVLLPSVVVMVQTLFMKQHPDVPLPTSAEVLAAFEATCANTLAKDDAWLAAHPKMQ